MAWRGSQVLHEAMRRGGTGYTKSMMKQRFGLLPPMLQSRLLKHPIFKNLYGVQPQTKPLSTGLFVHGGPKHLRAEGGTRAEGSTRFANLPRNLYAPNTTSGGTVFRSDFV